jgi:hypothetical protein
MKTLLSTIGLSTFLASTGAFAQGSLTPPGAPAPTMKSLDQIDAKLEKRIPISSAPFTIDQPGSYYLTTNILVGISDGIDILASGVTLDLNGFTILSTSAIPAGEAISFNGPVRNVTIMNGFIQGDITNNGSGVYNGGGFVDGINCHSYPTKNVRVSGVCIAGCLYLGIFLNTNDSTVVESCTVRTVGQYGINASTVRNCLAVDCGLTAIWADQASDSDGQSSTSTGILALTAQNCRGSTQGVSAGILALTAQNCYGYSSNSYGLWADTALNCYGRSGIYLGVFATTAQNCHGKSDSNYGLYANANANNCYGESTTGPAALYAVNASFCTASRPGGRAIQASIANGCYALGGTNLVAFKYNMP